MRSPQGGIFALGTNSHTYLELDVKAGVDGRALVTAVAGLREPRTTMGGVNLVAGFRPELWSAVMPDDSPPGLHGFNEDLRGTEGFVMPATQHDAVLWINGSAYDVVFDMARRAIGVLEGKGVVQRIDLGDGLSRYEARRDHHEHVRCDICGRVTEVRGCVVEGAAAEIERSTGYRLTSHSLVFSGVCPECASAAR